ncbi:hypothetical protein BDR07DRAFT_375654 [Suillus spraguei]|nr:hypothetical protein BDR07DRAFT_375654 [Suillus spraguei]
MCCHGYFGWPISTTLTHSGPRWGSSLLHLRTRPESYTRQVIFTTWPLTGVPVSTPRLFVQQLYPCPSASFSRMHLDVNYKEGMTLIHTRDLNQLRLQSQCQSQQNTLFPDGMLKAVGYRIPCLENNSAFVYCKSCPMIWIGMMINDQLTRTPP